MFSNTCDEEIITEPTSLKLCLSLLVPTLSSVFIHFYLQVLS